MKSKSGMIIGCSHCGDSFYIQPYERKTRKFCSLKCYWSWKKGRDEFKHWLGKVRPDLRGERNPMKRAENKEKISTLLRGRSLSKTHKAKISISRKGKRVGEDHPNWKGGVNKSGNGYISIYKGVNNYKYEHIDVMEKFLGRPLVKGEIVHHIDADTTNNSIENLKVMTHRDHIRLHYKQRPW